MAPKVIDLTGQRFGRLTVVSRDESFTGKGTRWLCDCDCGTKNFPVKREYLVRGKTKSCGCLKSEYLQSVLKDLTGQKFGKLTVVDRYEKKGKTYWLCNCDCGTKGVIASSSDLKNGDKSSCGCVRRQITAEKDLTGQKFGRLTVIGKSERRSANGDVYYICDCDCGTKGIEVVRSSLVAKDSHRQISCGCWVKEGHSVTNRHNDREEAIVTYLYGKLKVRHRKLGFGGEVISLDEYHEIINRPCAYCGLEKSNTTKESLFYTSKKKGLTSNHIDFDFEIHHNGVDRIDSSKGYVHGNVIPCCKYCNVAKSDFEANDFLAWAERVYQYFVIQESNNSDISIE